MPKLTAEQAYEADANDIKAHAARWLVQGNRTDRALYNEVCAYLNNRTASTQAILAALVDLCFTKRNANRPTDVVDTFHRIVHNQQERADAWCADRQEQP